MRAYRLENCAQDGSLNSFPESQKKLDRKAMKFSHLWNRTAVHLLSTYRLTWAANTDEDKEVESVVKTWLSEQVVSFYEEGL